MRSFDVVRIAKLTFAVCGTLLLLAVLWQLSAVVILVFLAMGMSAALEPMLRRLTDRGLPRWLALSIVYLGIAAFALFIPVAIAVPIASEFGQLAEALTHIQDADSSKTQSFGPFQSWLVDSVPWVQNWANENLGTGDAAAFWGLMGFTWGAFEALGNAIVVFVLSIYWSSDHDHFERLWLSLLSVERRAAARELWRQIQTEVGAYLRSETIQALLAGCALGVGYYLIGFPYPALLALISALAWLVPWGGIVIVLTALGLFSLPAVVSVGDHVLWRLTLPSILYTVVVLSLLEYFVEPRFFDRKRYNSLLVLLLVVVFAESFGIIGLLLAPPVAAALQIIGGFLVRQRTMAATTERSGTDRRIDEIWNAVEEIHDAPPELVSLLDRLARISHDVRQLPDAAPAP
jgi:putative permease